MSEEKVVSLHGGGKPDALKNGEPNPDVIAYCEKLLDKAKSGKLQWIASAQLADDGFFSTGWLVVQDGRMLQACGVIALLQHEFLAAVSDEREA